MRQQFPTCPNSGVSIAYALHRRGRSLTAAGER
jgi:hypothetical protein